MINIFKSIFMDRDVDNFQFTHAHSDDIILEHSKLVQKLENLSKQVGKKEKDFKCQLYRFQTMCSMIKAALWQKDKDLKYLYANKELLELVLNIKSAKQILGKTDVEVNPSSKAAQNCYRTDVETKKLMRTTRYIEISRRDDKELWLDVQKTPIIKNDEFVSIVGVAIDVTQHRKSIGDGLNVKIKRGEVVEIDNSCYMVLNESPLCEKFVSPQKKLGEILISQGICNAEQIAIALKQQRNEYANEIG